MLSKYLAPSTLIFLLSIVHMGSVQAWTLNTEQSSINFVSIKKKNIAESHRFTDFSGDIAEGRATIAIKPDSIDSRVPIRDERMRAFLFETDTFPIIEINANVNEVMGNLNDGDSLLVELPITVAMHGENKTTKAFVRVTAVTDTKLIVTSTQPILVRAADYKMTEGIQKLSSLVNNLPIAESVPVSFSLVFVQ